MGQASRAVGAAACAQSAAPHCASSWQAALTQGDLRVVMRRVLVGMRTGPLTCATAGAGRGGGLGHWQPTPQPAALHNPQTPCPPRACASRRSNVAALRSNVPCGCTASQRCPPTPCSPRGLTHLELLLLGATDQVRAHLLQVLHVAAGQRDADAVCRMTVAAAA